MKVFISQSKPRSLILAQALESFLRKVVPGTDPWVSDSADTGIEKGSRFMSEIRDNLGSATAGVVCLTSENRTESWILYEAGALSMKDADRVWTLLLDVSYSDVPDPLKGLNHTQANKADVLKMVQSIHKTLRSQGHKGCSDADLQSYFDAFWPALEKVIAALMTEGPNLPTLQTPAEETLSVVNTILQRLSEDRWREEKILAMLHVVYASEVGTLAPPLAVLTEMLHDMRRSAAEKAVQQIMTDGPPPSLADSLKAEIVKREFFKE